ncbi:endonuclease/exonuclease/phosphatase family protein [Halocynthiibacter namhaensis]|uniref:endonuclease/exonuclease/phosphatase family protein n=1 Tax=Halocynthiibacter namhaensis TaxID=1290553 RepID=UPI0005798AC7|nr:endonuclease/exonuclease/phosphatase family protein [Halocynthiibacter namhaensis]
MRIATWNVEWFNSLFDADDQPISDQNWSGRWNVKRKAQLDAIVRVLREIDADAIMFIEAPDSHAKRSASLALENLAKRYHLRQSKAVTGFANETQQEIALLFDPSKMTAEHDPKGTINAAEKGSPRFDTEFAMDLDVDATPEKVIFSKPPLELSVKTKSGKALRMIGVHVKSKAPHGAKNDADARRISIENRRKQLAQCIWLRQRVVEHVKADDDIIVLGDFNDGPGLDEFEKLFGRSGVEVVLGEEGKNCLFDPNARQALLRHGIAIPTTSRFFKRMENRYLSALLDYIMVSGKLRQLKSNWRIWHPFDDGDCYNDEKLRDALLTASDHFPVTIDIDL